MVKHLPTVRETRVQSLGLEDLLEKEMATHPSTLAWKIPQMEEPGGLQSMGSDTTERLHIHPNEHVHISMFVYEIYLSAYSFTTKNINSFINLSYIYIQILRNFQSIFPNNE